MADTLRCAFCRYEFPPAPKPKPVPEPISARKVLLVFVAGLFALTIASLVYARIAHPGQISAFFSSTVAAPAPPAPSVPPEDPEAAALGPKPQKNPFDGSVLEVKQYLRTHLNDYDSSEFVQWSEVSTVDIGPTRYWGVKLRLRAKNGFGAYIIKDLSFLIRGGEVVIANGL